MIKFDECQEIMQPVRFHNGASFVTIQSFKSVIESKFRENELDTSVTIDQFKSGGRFFNSTVEDCIVISNKNHPNDYFKQVIIIKKQGTFAYLNIYAYGKSKQMNKIAQADLAKEDRKGKALSYKIGSKIGSAIRTVGLNRSSVEEETMYYDAVITLLREIIEE